ncbi:hypothetical protein DA2_2230 [Desulfovibrio sp. A2]|nr:hypothetical protein DA2_2230 [Desulfovibrio sp. A2]
MHGTCMNWPGISIECATPLKCFILAYCCVWSVALPVGFATPDVAEMRRDEIFDQIFQH